mgnify:CR=1 FL=1
MYAKISLLLLIATIGLAQKITIPKDRWSLVGALENINILKHTAIQCEIFAFDDATQQYTQHSTLNSISQIQNIASAKGFFVYGSQGDCVIDTTKNYTDEKSRLASSNEAIKYKITLTNLTAGQPLAPLAIIAHAKDTFSIYSLGSPASLGLEELAESGSPARLLKEAQDKGVSVAVHLAQITATGSSQSLDIALSSNQLKLSVASMLVNTNDGFVALQDIDLDFTGKKEFKLNTYDAGTELNDELASSIPGLGSGEVDLRRSDSANIVTAHAGVITPDGGLRTSNLTYLHQFDNPAAMLTIEKL